jgi:cullin-4
MKQRKVMTHQNLVAEVIEQTRKRGAVELGEIKKNIESKFYDPEFENYFLLMDVELIEKDYIEREGGNYVYQA